MALYRENARKGSKGSPEVIILDDTVYFKNWIIKVKEVV